MRILVDENIPLMTVNELKKKGYDVQDIRGSKDEGLLDTKLWEIAQQENRLLITTDKGFSQYRELYHSGILIIRLRQPNRYKIHQRTILALSHFSEVEWQGMIVTMRDKTMNVVTTRRMG
ncbi:DUF5615 family PIN-like protein [bacterium]|nr:DUF5615 family PIN-like protein [bacterium]